MNKEQTKECIRIMQAFVDGKAVQYRYSDAAEWFDANGLSELSWNWIAYDYRIKPEPKIIYVNEYMGGGTAETSIGLAFENQEPGRVAYVRLSDVELLK